jgi:DNA-3-methyladenine glycosylase
MNDRIKLTAAFYQRDAATVARALLGTVLVHRRDGLVQRGRVVETEAYLGEHDLACHAAKGRTARTEVMFGPGGHAYVYLIYGLYDMLNIVTGEEGQAQAVLIRALEPLAGITGRTDGPGRLTRALGITRRHNGLSLLGDTLYLEAGIQPEAVAVTARIGVDYAGAWKEAPLRFVAAGSRFVSRS